MNNERISNRRQLLEAYLILHNFRIIRTQEGVNMRLTMKCGDHDYHLRVDHEWLRLTANVTVQTQLDTLGLVPFLRENGAAWIGVTATGQETITHLAG